VSDESLLQYALFIAILALSAKPVGAYLTRVFAGERTWLDRALRPVERAIYRVAGIDSGREMSWSEYATAFVLFSGVGTIVLYLVLRLQSWLPWFDATHMTTALSPDLAANTAISFATTTTWQAYAGETTMSYVSQIVGLAAQNFLAGAAGLAVGIAFIRGLARERSTELGNFWVDLVRGTLWVLVPLSLVGGAALLWQGVPMSVQPYTHASTLEGGAQVIAQGPVAALELIKNLGTNGGGFFNVNGAHPYETPTPLANLISMLAIALLPAGLTYTYGRMVGNTRQGWMLFWSMTVLFTAGLAATSWSERGGNPLVAKAANVSTISSDSESGGNMEGKEVRFGIGGSVLAAVTTSNGATGSYNSMHDSYMPLGGAVPLVNMLLGEVVFGGLGTGLYSILEVALLGLFITGLMIGRTPSFLGKRIGPTEVKLIILYALIAPAVVLGLTAVAVSATAGTAGLTTNTGAHGFTEILFAYASAVANNGQSFAGLTANSPFYNVTTAAAMMAGRFLLAITALALAGRFASESRLSSEGSVPTDTPLFGAVLIGTTVVVGALTFLPALALGPLAEHVGMLAAVAPMAK
jgi:potassium-transporting ATPase potassium-binding subunit